MQFYVPVCAKINQSTPSSLPKERKLLQQLPNNLPSIMQQSTSQNKFSKRALIVVGVIVFGIIAVVYTRIEEEREAWMMAKEFLAESVVREGELAGDDTWKDGYLRFPLRESAVITRKGGGFEIASDFDIDYQDQKIRNHFTCAIKLLGSELLENEPPMSMLPKAAHNPKVACETSAGGTYRKCHYYDFTDVEFRVRPVANWKRLQSLNVDSLELRIGTEWDQIARALKAFDYWPPGSRPPDPVNETNLSFSRQYRLNGKFYRIEFRRFDNMARLEGAFRIFKIEERLK